jgi:hypothetical protein
MAPPILNLTTRWDGLIARKGKAVPVQACPEGFRSSRVPDLRQSAHEGGKVSPTHRPPLSTRKYPWYLFLLEAESTSGP